MNRKTFIQKILATILITLPAYIFVRCSSDTGNESSQNPIPIPTGNCLNNGTNNSIDRNHGHSLNVSKEDIQAGIDKAYSIQGSANHNHIITVTTANFSSLRNNNSINVTSTSGGGHTHTVTVSCA
ncbi:hypothetical protein [Tenacibaculum caenipelagi]|uniref:Uncharacterized protein n=1 Tax=Tenacibaculum caenipelagi TaxID=1325435 RepID=A0A4R6TC41_9FLAO|nr:hypothetical protein [Tenacibaculum caenipelagi]TDQ25563.1 hypothetical protein DFQ07_1988 [Tenacibaculum caenipelagi]